MVASSGVAAGDDRVHRRIDLDQFLQRFLAAHSARQSKIENDSVETFARFEFFAIDDSRLPARSRPA